MALSVTHIAISEENAELTLKTNAGVLYAISDALADLDGKLDHAEQRVGMGLQIGRVLLEHPVEQFSDRQADVEAERGASARHR